MSRPRGGGIPKSTEQHRMSSPHLHEVEQWRPARPRVRKPQPQLEGQADLLEAIEELEQ